MGVEVYFVFGSGSLDPLPLASLGRLFASPSLKEPATDQDGSVVQPKPVHPLNHSTRSSMSGHGCRCQSGPSSDRTSRFL